MACPTLHLGKLKGTNRPAPGVTPTAPSEIEDPQWRKPRLTSPERWFAFINLCVPAEAGTRRLSSPGL